MKKQGGDNYSVIPLIVIYPFYDFVPLRGKLTVDNVFNLAFLFLFCFRMKVHKNGNAADVIKSISQIDNSNKQC